MDFQFWIWLIIVAVTLISRALKKSAKTNQPQPNQQENTPEHKPVSFEDLLREIQASKTPEAPKSIQRAKPIKSYEVDYDDDLEEEEKDLETIPNDDARSYEAYEKAKREAFSRPSLEETLKLEDTPMNYSHFKGYEEAPQKGMGKEILEDFKDPERFRKAFIMSEILKRKF